METPGQILRRKSLTDTALAEMGKRSLHPAKVEGSEFFIRHFPGRHRERAMVATGHISGNADVIRFIGEDDPRDRARLVLLPMSRCRNGSTGSIAADKAVRSELKRVAYASDRNRVRLGLEGASLDLVALAANDDLINFVERKA